MKWTRVIIRANDDQYDVEAFARKYDDKHPVFKKTVDNVEIDGMMLDTSDFAEITHEHRTFDVRLSDGQGMFEDGSYLHIETDTGCDHPVIGIEKF